jgi:hypothetical protein
MRIKAQIRENSKGSWWANVTYNGYDYSVERDKIGYAKTALHIELIEAGFLGELQFEQPVFYPKKEKRSTNYIGNARMRIDNHPIG